MRLTKAAPVLTSTGPHNNLQLLDQEDLVEFYCFVTGSSTVSIAEDDERKEALVSAAEEDNAVEAHTVKP